VEMPRSVFVLCGAALLSGCAAHSFPLSNKFVYPSETSDRAEVFSDVNGTLYPAGWQSHFRPRMSKKHPGEARWLAGSLLAQTSQKSKFRNLIERDGDRQLGEIKSFAARHKRIFILVHGFNSSVEESEIPFSAIEAQINLQPGDGVIRFYWDGLIGKGLGAIKVWLKAANASQTVGSRGLRSVLNQIEGREVYVIAHSRGASVALSALGNPVYSSKYLKSTNQRARGWGKAYRSILSPKPLSVNGNSLHLLMLAPAIDRIDFCSAAEQPLSSKGFVCGRFRSLGSQVKSFAYTVNPSDPMLGKLFLSSRALIPTGFGYDPQTGRDLKSQHYGLLREYVFDKPESFHGFKDYAAHPVFLRMLEDAGIGKAAPTQGTNTPPAG
jgi:Alpha/beta hydrolase of unknown function (DUF900)